MKGLAPLGPILPSGSFALLGIVDDGGGADLVSQNTLVSFALTGIPEPGTGVLLVVGMVGILARKRVLGRD